MVFVVGRREWYVFSDDDRRPGSLTDGLDAPLHANVKHYLCGSAQARQLPTAVGVTQIQM